MFWLRTLLLGAAAIAAAALPPPIIQTIVRNELAAPDTRNATPLLQTSRKITTTKTDLERRLCCPCGDRTSSHANRATEENENYEQPAEKVVKQVRNDMNERDTMETVVESTELGKTRNEETINPVELAEITFDTSSTTVKNFSQSGVSGVLTPETSMKLVVGERKKEPASDNQLLADEADAAKGIEVETRTLGLGAGSLNAVAQSEKENATNAVTVRSNLKQIEKLAIMADDLPAFSEYSEHDELKKNLTSEANKIGAREKTNTDGQKQAADSMSAKFTAADEVEASILGTTELINPGEKNEVEVVTKTVTMSSNKKKENNLSSTTTPKLESRIFHILSTIISKLLRLDEVQNALTATVDQELVKSPISSKDTAGETGASPLESSKKALNSDKQTRKENINEPTTVSSVQDLAFTENDRGLEHELEMGNEFVYSTVGNFSEHDVPGKHFSTRGETRKLTKTLLHESLADAEDFTKDFLSDEIFATVQDSNSESSTLDKQTEEKDMAATVTASTDLIEIENKTENYDLLDPIEINSRLFDTSLTTLQKFHNEGVVQNVSTSEETKVSTPKQFDNNMELANRNANESEPVILMADEKNVNAGNLNVTPRSTSVAADYEAKPATTLITPLQSIQKKTDSAADEIKKSKESEARRHEDIANPTSHNTTKHHNSKTSKTDLLKKPTALQREILLSKVNSPTEGYVSNSDSPCGQASKENLEPEKSWRLIKPNRRRVQRSQTKTPCNC